eukprot:gnl/TRDRNA2_/TRDRNA2_156156_c0_seq2.p1 gnl/TRDRNA2_/TRDRNA2_156156_c0~~gnl/TRDRNA2_/TRDRNA2_156156_c0_seq2.p1  ORF type:complete len:404 (-),score=55.95 gnl/TRDRNA2_/TRDRNA2_156156_c0_seq2:802-2013(-)
MWGQSLALAEPLLPHVFHAAQRPGVRGGSQILMLLPLIGGPSFALLVVSSQTGRRLQERRLATTESYACNYPDCTFVAANGPSLYYHKRTQHLTNGAKDFKCSIAGCNFAALHQQHLEYHYRVKHTKNGGRDYACDFPGCRYVACHKSHLDNHKMRKHDRMFARYMKARDQTDYQLKSKAEEKDFVALREEKDYVAHREVASRATAGMDRPDVTRPKYVESSRPRYVEQAPPSVGKFTYKPPPMLTAGEPLQPNKEVWSTHLIQKLPSVTAGSLPPKDDLWGNRIFPGEEEPYSPYPGTTSQLNPDINRQQSIAEQLRAGFTAPGVQTGLGSTDLLENGSRGLTAQDHLKERGIDSFDVGRPLAPVKRTNLDPDFTADYFPCHFPGCSHSSTTKGFLSSHAAS